MVRNHLDVSLKLTQADILANYEIPNRADLKSPFPRELQIKHNLKFLNSSEKSVKRSRKLKDLDMKMQVLKEILRFKKAKERFEQKTREIEIKNSSEVKMAPPIASGSMIPLVQVHSFSLSNGVDLSEDLKPFTSIIIELMNHIYAPSFNAPVDWVLLNLPDYPEKIKRPMDLGTAKSNLEKGVYKSSDALISDIRQVWTNAQIYNPEGNIFNTMSKTLSKIFENRLKELGKTGQFERSGFVRDISFDSHSNHSTSKNEVVLTDSDYDKATGEVVELSFYEKDILKQQIMSVQDPKPLEIIVDLIRTDPRYKKMVKTKKLEFEVGALNNVVVRKLYKFVNSIPNIKNLSKKDNKKIKLNPDYHLKQINTKISNEFGNNHDDFIKSITEKNFQNKNTAGKISDPLNKNSAVSSKKDEVMSKNDYISKLLAESSSSEDSESEESENDTNNKKNNSANKNNNGKIMWDWIPKTAEQKPISPNGTRFPNFQQNHFNKPNNLSKNNGVLNGNGRVASSIISINNSALKMANYSTKTTKMANSANLKMANLKMVDQKMASSQFIGYNGFAPAGRGKTQNIAETLSRNKFASSNFLPPVKTQTWPGVNDRLSEKEKARINREKQSGVCFNIQQDGLEHFRRRFQQ